MNLKDDILTEIFLHLDGVIYTQCANKICIILRNKCFDANPKTRPFQYRGGKFLCKNNS